MRLFAIFIALALIVPVSAFAATGAKPTAPVKTARTAAPVARTTAKTDYNCSDFKTRAEAQAKFTAAGGPKSDPYRLDGDKDGIPCEELK